MITSLCVAACKMHNFRLRKALVPLLSHLASNEHTLKNSTDFVNDIRKVNNANNLYMCSLDIEPLYTSIPVSEAMTS